MNALKLVSTTDLTRDAWLDWRRKGIGGSEAAAVAGLSRFNTPMQVYLDKLGMAPEVEENEAMYWGTQHEDMIAKEFSKRTGLKVRKNNQILMHPEYSFMLANLDRDIVGAREGLECKNLGAFRKKEWDAGELWEHELQCHHYLAVTGYKRWWLAALLGGNQFVYKVIERDETIITNLIKTQWEFWHNHIIPQIPPLPDGSEASSNLLKSIYPDSNGQAIDLPSTVEGWIEQYEQALLDEKEVTERKEEAANNIKALLGEYEEGNYKNRQIFWKTINKKAYTVKESSYRRLSIKKLEA